MFKAITILLLFVQVLFADTMKLIEKYGDIPKNKDVILMFTMNFCPYCSRQEKSLMKYIQPDFPNIAYLKVKRGTSIHQQLIQTGNFGEVEYYPTTFILKKYTDDSLYVKFPFQGYQRASDIRTALLDKEIMED